MDWSLVLVSQGIETEIEFEAEGAGWGLRVPPAEHERAAAVIRQYRIENRRWPWRREVRGGVLFDWASVAWLVLISFFYWVNAARADLKGVGVMDSTAVWNGEVWRVFTAMWLHADLRHLAANATIGLVLLGLVMGRYGTGLGLLAAVLGGAGGNILAGALDSDPHRSLGASGLVMACLGLLAVQSFMSWRRPPLPAKEVIVSVMGGGMLFVLLGLTPGTDILAHFGGFVTGLALGLLYASGGEYWKRSWPNVLAGFLFVLAVVWPWFLALRKAG